MSDSPTNEAAVQADSAPEARQWRCPICHGVCDPASPSAPFCSQRCKLVDLGKWLNGQYAISRDLKDADLDGD